MAYGYLFLAAALAFTLNHANGVVRAAGTLTAAIGLLMIVVSIVLADVDGTFAAFAARSTASTPLILNIQAALAALAIPFLVGASWVQWRRGRVEMPRLGNSGALYGSVSRAFHWVMAVLILCLVPIGLFTSVLPKGSDDRAGFLAAHQSLGIAVLVLGALRLAWLAVSPSPGLPARLTAAARFLARLTRVALYLMIALFPLSGFLMNVFQGDAVDLFGWSLALQAQANPALADWCATLHELVLPALFYTALAAHLGAAIKHHFVDRQAGDIRRMLA
jgi:cytochrome b561